MRASLGSDGEYRQCPERAREIEYGNDTIQKAASDLCLEISRFTTSPLFKPGAVYNLRYAIEADNALDAVINISSNIKTVPKS